ncbi:M3 family oligoendopeptidase [Inediibacterium massiliense]|uniref:M3 family oligoendopeptidase n=1 Tax=Inediibacterium massiliense TaxID=1658111 RepID=UPI0006B5B226|nr:M3 family oligoendopeptidase [Inediibacterium massiliense]
MKFSGFEYERPDIKNYEEKFNHLLQKFCDGQSFEEEDQLLQEINLLRNEFESMKTIVYIRHCIDTKDSFYKEEQNFFDQYTPIYENLISQYYKALTKSKYKNDLEKKWGSQLFKIAHMKKNVVSFLILKDLNIENNLMSEYTTLLSSAKIYFQGKYHTLPQMRLFQMDIDRNIRKKAVDKKYDFFMKNEKHFDEIYDELVKVRDQMAKKIGYKNFVQLGYDRMIRIDYNQEMIKNLRENIKKYIVPLSLKLREEQRKKLNLNELYYYDELIYFKKGNAKLELNPNEILHKGLKMYEDLSEETKYFFEHMIKNNLLDVLSKSGKSPAGFCTYIKQYKTPFIFANFNGTADDIDVLTHEAGHALQMYLSKDYLISEYNFPTLDACEIHAMSMEFFTYPYMDHFFENADQYRQVHLREFLHFIPYGALVDEFQHHIYENPNMSIKDRKDLWAKLENEYIPYRNYGENEYLKRGGYWHQQGHIFKNPFYYIDYILAGICALQFFMQAKKDFQSTWKNYMNVCKTGGSKSFLELVNIGKIKSPFEEDCIKNMVQEIQKQN